MEKLFIRIFEIGGRNKFDKTRWRFYNEIKWNITMIWKSKGKEVNGFCFIKKKTNHKNKKTNWIINGESINNIQVRWMEKHVVVCKQNKKCVISEFNNCFSSRLDIIFVRAFVCVCVRVRAFLPLFLLFIIVSIYIDTK